MHPKEREIREAASAVPFTFVTASSERYKVPTPGHISFFPETDEDGISMPDEERAEWFIVYGKRAAHRLLFFQGVTAIDVGRPPNPIADQ